MNPFSDETLSAYVDGDLDPAKAAEVRAAEASAPELADRVEAIRQMKQAAPELVGEPPRDLWPEIRRQLRKSARSEPWWKAWLEPRRVGWVAAPMVAMAAWMMVVLPEAEPEDPAEAALAQARTLYKSAITELEAQVDERMAKLDPETRSELAQSLKVVDDAIARAEAVLEGPSRDAYAHHMVQDLYEEKVRVLRSVLSLTAEDEGA